VYVVLICVVATLTTGDSPVTVTVSASALTFSETSSSTTAPTATGMLSRRSVPNPCSTYSRS
jgi:hypothetical protein